jgi:UDP-GlcNAc3NAcA epimerase
MITDNAVANLAREGITRGVHQVGDVMYDSVLFNAELAKQRSDILARMRLKPGEYALATVHRAENTDDPVRLAGIFQALSSIAREGLRVAAPLHPRTRKKLVASGLDLGNVEVGEPLPYLDMLMLEMNAKVIVTDSGGVQKEAYWFGAPCVTVRDETEWVETVESGWNRVVGSDADAIVQAIQGASPATAERDAYGDGTASERIAKMLNG